MFGRWRDIHGEFFLGVLGATDDVRALVRLLVQANAVDRVYETQLGQTIQFVEDEDIDGLPWLYCVRETDRDAMVALLASEGIFTRPVYPPVGEGCV